MKTKTIVLVMCFQLSSSYCQTTYWRSAAQLLGGSARCVCLTPDGRVMVPTDSGLLLCDMKDHWKTLHQRNLPHPVKILYAAKTNTLFAAKDSCRLYLLREGSSTWKRTSLFLENPTAVVSAGPGTVYISDGKKVFLSEDDGAHWISRSKGLDLKDKDSRFYQSDEETESLAILCLCLDSCGNVYAGSNGFGVFELPAGESVWQRTGNELLTMSDDQDITALCSTADNILYAGTDGDHFYRSTNHGEHWSEIHASFPEYLSINVLAVDSKDILYAGFGMGILISNDSGKTWIHDASCLATTSVTSIAIDKNDRVFLGTRDAGVFESTDHGGSFRQIGIPIEHTLEIHALGTDRKGNLYFSDDQGVYRKSPDDPCWRKTADARNQGTDIYTAIGNDSSGNVLIGHFMGHLYRSTDGGEKWEDFAKGVPIGSIHCISSNQSGNVFVGNVIGVVVTRDNGKSWRRLNVPNEPIVHRISFNSQGHIYLANLAFGPQLSIDNGNTWIDLKARLENPRAYPNQYFGQLIMESFAFDADDHPLVAMYQGIYRSIDHERNWTKIFSVQKQLVRDVIPLEKGLIIAATEKSGVFVSKDNGATWELMNEGLPNLNISRMMKTQDGVLYLATNGGVYKSSVPIWSPVH